MALGEKHNGKAVTEKGDGFIHKPRTIFWEWLFLGKDSPLRNLVSRLSMSGANPMAAFPELEFSISNDQFYFGTVEKLELDSGFNLGSDEAYAAGGTFATASWFGLTDLHFENVMTGTDKDSRFIFCPIDIECVFESLELFSQTQLVGAKGGKIQDTGSKELLGRSINTAALCSGFIDGLSFFEAAREKIDQLLLNELAILDIPKRIILKPTRDYVLFLRDGVVPKKGFHQEEMVQLARGDVPYFFNSLNDDRLKFLGLENQWETSDRPPSMGEVLPSQYGGGSFARDFGEDWIKNALCQICRTFDVGLNRQFRWNGFEVTYRGQYIYIKTGNGWRIKCERALQLYFAA